MLDDGLGSGNKQISKIRILNPCLKKLLTLGRFANICGTCAVQSAGGVGDFF